MRDSEYNALCAWLTTFTICFVTVVAAVVIVLVAAMNDRVVWF